MAQRADQSQHTVAIVHVVGVINVGLGDKSEVPLLSAGYCK
jgi:hypothetical protein